MVRCPSYLVLSKTFLLGVGLTDLSEFGRYFGQNKAIVSVFHGPVIYFQIIVVLIFLARVVVLVANFILFFENISNIWPLTSLQILCPVVKI